MATKTYSQKITNAKVLIDGLKKIKSNLPAGIRQTLFPNEKKSKTRYRT